MLPQVFLLSVLLCGSSLASWQDLPYGDSDFNIQATYGDNVTLNCSDGRVDDNNLDVKLWVLPDLSIMRPNESYTFPTLDGKAGWTVSDNGREIHITILQEVHFGFYHCYLGDTVGPEFVVKRAINYKGPSFPGLWDKYRDATIDSCSASGAFMIICIVGAVVYSQKYDIEVAPEPEMMESYDIGMAAHTNKAFEEDKKVEHIDMKGMNGVASSETNDLSHAYTELQNLNEVENIKL